MQLTIVFRKKQQGMTLLIGLVFLLMLMVISTIGFRNTTMSERMTGNTVDRNISFQSAENAGKEALVKVENSFAAVTPTPLSAIGTGYYSAPLTNGGTTTFWNKGDGATVSVANCATTTPFSWTSCSATVANKYDFSSTQIANKAQFVIEFISSVSDGTSTQWTYRITSRSTGGSGNADVVLQTMYVRTTTP
ncbi:PilX N-terminal domain-containing pilus assembly protein [Rhodoferax saidenbachensis]|uniref:Type IV pilus assembly protein PilX n=1 Tax=Rhodoferax saidenbachensis TaxID=1484693 RepID=A0ABU1ZSA6_9BURK|nr:PilX N-terminal domain-containing pilus assembly protein [Rhodoferax saidenbachensis]MDR7308422.1 type IV pilus assembly protein PilX [Rhodoferax saidenbachensis]